MNRVRGKFNHIATSKSSPPHIPFRLNIDNATKCEVVPA